MIKRRPRAQIKQPSDDEIAHGLSGVLICGLERALKNAPIVKSARVRLADMGLIKKQKDHFSRITPRGLTILRIAKANPQFGDRTLENAAIAMEARQGGNAEGSAVHESAGPEGIVQPLSPSPINPSHRGKM